MPNSEPKTQNDVVKTKNYAIGVNMGYNKINIVSPAKRIGLCVLNCLLTQKL